MKIRVLSATLLMIAALCVCADRVNAAPALWVVQSPVGKVYLFGTVHVLCEGTAWRTPELDAAIGESGDLYLEVSELLMNSTAVAAFRKLGIDLDHPLSTKLSKDDIMLLDKAAKRLGFPGEAMFEPMRPWLAGLVLEMAPAKLSGYAAASGVDVQIRKSFSDAGKPVKGFETVDMQGHFFADVPEPLQVTALQAVLRNPDVKERADRIDALVDAWNDGDQQKLASMMHVETLPESFVTTRNKAWASVLAERLKHPGISFVAVGAGHLLGPDGVPALLEQMGFTLDRVAQSTPMPSPPTPTATVLPATTSPKPTSTSTPITHMLNAPRS